MGAIKFINYIAARGCPADCVCYNSLNDFVMICGICFVTGLEIEYSAKPSLPAASGAENFAAGEPAHKYDFIGLRNIKSFAIHFFTGKNEIFGNTLSDGMSGIYVPNSFFVAVTPRKIAACSHKFFEYF